MKFLFIRLILFSILLCSCALKPIAPEYNFIKINVDEVDIKKLGNGNVLVYNGADALHKMDNTGRLNIWIQNKALGQIKPNEYVIINLKKGEYLFNVVHIDMVKMKSNHKILVDEKTKIIKIKPTLTSNKLSVSNILPNNFDKFSPVEN